MFYRIIFLYWLLVVSKVQFSSLCRLFSVVHEHRLQEYSKCRAYQRLLRLHIVLKPWIKNKHNKSFIMWKRNSFKISLQIWRLSKVSRDRLAVYLILEIFWTVSLKVNACFDGPELNECNLSWKIVNYCILYEVCMIKTAPHSTLSPQM